MHSFIKQQRAQEAITTSYDSRNHYTKATATAPIIKMNYHPQTLNISSNHRRHQSFGMDHQHLLTGRTEQVSMMQTMQGDDTLFIETSKIVNPMFSNWTMPVTPNNQYSPPASYSPPLYQGAASRNSSIIQLVTQ